MTLHECPREPEVVAAVLAQGGCLRAIEDGWLHACDDELRIHADGCEVCRDAGALTAVFQAEALTARRDLRVPSAGQVWWRAAIRARADAVCEAERPLTWVHGLAGACATGALVAAAGAAWPSLQRGVQWAASWPSAAPTPAFEAAALAIDMLQRVLPVALAATACIVVVPLAIYLATSDD